MTINEALKNKIMNDPDFQNKCSLYNGVDYRNFDICGDGETEPITIILNTPDKDVFIFMDENYHTIGIDRLKKDENYSFNQIAYDFRSIYNYVSVFYNLTLNDITSIADRVIYKDSRHMIVNGEEVEMDEGERYIELLSLMKFLGEKIEDYFVNYYKNTIQGLNCPSVFSYATSIMNKFYKYVDKCVLEDNGPCSLEISHEIGTYNDTIRRIINLLFRQKGYEVYCGKLHLTNEYNDLYEKSENLLKLLWVPKEEVNDRLKNASKNFWFYEVNLERYLTSDIKTM